ncbi:16S rRNA (cytosine(1402)-N(4))-methyltransferase RsmH [Nitratiruptor sp. SB155-2]|uniref:Ribosomal RNA small subunit methyltransferase H n=1 Tax=Nitratiruptor sp. (strain SB155-2) TaxID=387092 RepID=RSMH_NITSB|nr:16S rRNA (cytosine(1402)-N(4))-methyltransferase RsmH [Nitratiruptor sp. SB155-2]A6Q3T0.1 RecName: Full=Ribosomal RNA small subunit methyltransferase H; AltName: Full=16S rRNA m(4)C1402 methyltransferase; AltName: Full=rRNA (cytosine-N(4)-)-methyltransferase RsmH [Nitratiruptor sp. SB155-2]BAF70139.1 S-adenosyl-methyltransferase MraW [Nitratiruptor sp. SB155-2]
MNAPHKPVLLNEVLESFKDRKGTIVDATLGYGGHSEALLKSNPDIKIVGIDQDSEAIAFSKQRLASYGDRVQIIQGRFADVIEDILQTHDVQGVLADIGVSSLQLDKKDRGFSIHSENLDMRMDQNAELSAYHVVNTYDEEELKRIFKEYGEIRHSGKLAKAIIHNRPIQSATQLAEIAQKILPKNKRVHPATTLFQAIRIEVNKELDQLKGLLDALERHKPKGAKVAIITFHSLEDRIVKQHFKEWAKSCICPPEAMRCTCGANHALGNIVTKKPIVASIDELEENPRARSAKLRVFQFKE